MPGEIFLYSAFKGNLFEHSVCLGIPIIILGDFNARYTRDDYATNFWNVLDADLSADLQDPWTELIWGGTYPDYGTPSWVVTDKYDPNNGVGDIEYGEQEGEVVDKIIYINNPASDVRIWAKSYKLYFI